VYLDFGIRTGSGWKEGDDGEEQNMWTMRTKARIPEKILLGSIFGYDFGPLL